MYLKLENITKRYETKLAVDNLSLQVPQGAIYGIIGPNGAGKTTTIRMVMNIIAPDSGTILFDGKKIDDSFRNRAGYLPEERGLYKKMTLNEIIIYLAELKDCRRSQIIPKIGPWLDSRNEIQSLQQPKFVLTIVRFLAFSASLLDSALTGV